MATCCRCSRAGGFGCWIIGGWFAQFAALERRTSSVGRDRIDHPVNMHDDLSNATAGALVAAADRTGDAVICAPIIVSSPLGESRFSHPGW
jgi:hypothetical protein